MAEFRIFSLLAWIIHEDSASRGNMAKQVGQSSDKRGSLTCQNGAEEDGPICDARFSSGVEKTHCYFEKGAKKVI